MPKAIDEYYLLLARRVDVVGSNKGEVFQVNRLPDGQVRVQLFDRAVDTENPRALPCSTVLSSPKKPTKYASMASAARIYLR